MGSRSGAPGGPPVRRQSVLSPDETPFTIPTAIVAPVPAALSVATPARTSVRSVARAARWLLWIAEHEGASATDVARAFDVPLPTVHHTLSTLAQEGLLEKDAGRRYHMGANVGVLSGSFVREQGVPSQWQRALAELASETGETAHLAAWRGGEIRILAGVEGSRAVRVPDIHIGSYAHAHARAAGKLLLALAPPAQRDAYLALHPPTRADREDDHEPGALERRAGADPRRSVRDRQRGVRRRARLPVGADPRGRQRARRAQRRGAVAALSRGAPAAAAGRPRSRRAGRSRGEPGNAVAVLAGA